MTVTREYVAIGGFNIYWYGVLIALGAFLALGLACRRERRQGLEKDTAVNLALICVPAGIVGARLYYVALHSDMYSSLRDVLALRDGGLGIYGGVLLAVICLCVYAAVKKIKLITLTDLLAPCLAVGQAVGRWGNFLNCEAYGAEITAKAWQFFPMSVNIDGKFYAATFFYESLWCAVICLVICRKTRRRGCDTALYITLYAFERAYVESLRLDSLYIGGARASQLLSAILLAAVLVVLWLKLKPRPISLLPALLAAAVCIMGTLTLLPQWAVYAALPVVAAGNLLLIRKYDNGR